MPEALIVIPFSVLRLILPADGDVIGFNLRTNVWPKNARKGAFEQHERVEFAFGWILRAKAGDRRKYERPDPPGLVDAGTHVSFKGGWRAHKKMKVVEDYFDGAFRGRVRFQHQEGGVSARISQFQLSWNGGIVEAVSKLLLLQIEQHIGKEIQGRLNRLLSSRFKAELGPLLAKHPALTRLRERTRLTFEGTSLAIAVNTD